MIPKKRQHHHLPPAQRVEYDSHAIASFVGRGPKIDVFHSVTYGIVRLHCS